MLTELVAPIINGLKIETVEELESHARSFRYLNKESDVRLCPGMHMPRVLGEPIDGTYGLQLIDPDDTETVLAMMGFNINGSVLEITQTPTGACPTDLTPEQKNILRLYDFRNYLIQNVIDIATKLGIEEIKGHSVLTHPSIKHKIENDEITEDQANKALDRVYEQAGFSRTWDDRFVLQLEERCIAWK